MIDEENEEIRLQNQDEFDLNVQVSHPEVFSMTSPRLILLF